MMSKRQTDVLDEVRKRALAELNIKVSREDPVFSVVFATEAVLERMTEPLVLAVKQIPGEMGISIEKIASAVEDAEQTVERLVEEGKTALAEVRDTEAKKLVKVVRESLEGSKGVSHTKFSIVMALCFFFASTTLGIGGYSYFAVKDAMKDANYWYTQYKASRK
ncbi:hypothetical protein ISF08_30445 [Pseudomonas aeruginosa]|uniref:Conjugal transfer protein TraM n=3 Tax=Pseudomonas aeruginosa TaxID=287 RepID=A0A218MAS3_PSEAI|nr:MULTISPECIES: hypothetical protein [Pseudomonas]ASD54088.1 Conjugal transfer protein TraM [Pseudomonas aeruginosa]AZZ88934.1 hypothetical protein ALFBHDGB_00076 [Pseudomonas aeruginosa]KSQ71592.1 hypothetical protein APB36_21435 [Pseudomonas aeruginosa]MBJ7563049.1 hypothetical protein [Pseudomonas sp. P20]MBJ7569393.1 hypothetical protein [Pseudomonas sp. P22]